MAECEGGHELLSAQYPPAEFDVELCNELVERIQYKNPTMDVSDAQNLAVRITKITGFLCSAFENHFVEEIDALVGVPEYCLRVFMSRIEGRFVD